jgi:hypothetical protein
LDPAVATIVEERGQVSDKNDGSGEQIPNEGGPDEDEYDVFDEEAWTSYASELDDMANLVNLDDLADLDDLDELSDLNGPAAAPESEPESERELEDQQPESEVAPKTSLVQTKEQEVSLDTLHGSESRTNSNKDTATSSTEKRSIPVPLPQIQKGAEEEEVLETSDVEEGLILDI